MPSPNPELMHSISEEVRRLSETAHDIEAHLEEALTGDTLEQHTITGIQQIDAISQILKQLSILLREISETKPISFEEMQSLLEKISLESLRARLACTPVTENLKAEESLEVDIF